MSLTTQANQLIPQLVQGGMSPQAAMAIAIELTGFQTLDRITLYTLDIEGVQP